ncbi:MAG: hypothetical protein OXG35_09155 [Acidobacteria bacterium]|nr:hypothetical protein [Acidobacteriota bacterium]
MPRPKVAEDEKRRRELAILLTGPESRAVREAARRRGQRPSAFVRAAAIAAAVAVVPDVREEPPQLAPDPGAIALRREIRRLGNNLNQAVRLAHEGGHPNLLKPVEELRAAIAQVLTQEIRSLESTLDRVMKLAQAGEDADLLGAVHDLHATVAKASPR